MTNQQKKIIEKEFYRYKENKKAGGQFLDDFVARQLASTCGKDRVKGTGENGIESGIIAAIDKETVSGAIARKWAIVYEKTRDKYFCEGKDKLMQKVFQERKSVFRVCSEIGIQRRTYFYWLDEILNTAKLWANALGIYF